MAQSVLLPDGSSVTIRAGETPQSAYARAQQMYPEAFGVGAEPEDQPKSGFMPALKAGFSNLKGDVAALAGRTGIMGLPEAEKYIAEQEAYQKKTFAPTTKSFTEAPLTNIAELAAGSAPYMLAPLAAGATALALPATIAAAPVLGGLATAGTALGLGAAGLTSAAQFTGSNLSRQVDTGKKLGETDLTNAALASIPMAALDTVSMRMIPGLGKMFERAGLNISAKAAQDLAKEGIKKTATDYLFATSKTMGIEGLTEAGQQVFERMQAGLNLTDPAARAEYFDNFLGGAVLGGILAPAGRYVERGQEQGRFDKNQRDAQKQRSLEESQAKAEADAKLEAKRQTPEYALNAQQVYQAAEKKQADLQAAIHKGAKNQKLTEEQKQENKETTLKLKEHAAVLSDAAADYRRSKQFLPVAAPPAPEAITDTTALQNQMALIPGAEAPAPTAPELDLLGQPLARVAPEAAAVEPTDFRQQVRQLQQLVEQYNTQAQDATPAEIIKLLPKYEVAQAALVEAQKNIGKSVEEQLAAATKKMEAAKILGDLPAAAKHAQKVIDLQSQIAPKEQQGIDMPAQERGYYGTSETSPQFGGRLSRAESEAYVDRRTQERGQERGEAAKQKEVDALGRIGEKPSPGSPEINEQLGLFGANDQEAGPTTPSSAPLGQMKQILTGEDVTATAPEEGKRQVQRGGKAPFKLLSRREGTEEPLTAEELRQRIDRLQLRDDLSDDAYAFLTRVSNRVPETDKDGILTLIDEQLARIERNEEGFVPKGAGKEALYDAFPVQTPPTSTVTPTLASGKDFGTRTDTEAKALARARAKRYKEVIDKQIIAKQQAEARGEKFELKPAQAAYQARLITQADIEGPFQGRPDEFKAPTGEVKVQKRVDDLAKVRKTGGPREQAATLRGPSATAIEMGMYPDALEQYLRVREDLDAAEQAGQMDLFGEKELAATALTRATPAMFQRYLNSGAVKEMRSREKEATQQVAALPEIKKVSQSISELEQKLSSIKSLWETTATAKSILAGNTKAKEALTAYGRLQNDPMFSSILSLSASSKSEEHAQLQESIKVYNNALDDIREQIATTEKLIGKAPKKDNRVKLDILSQQQTKLQSTLNKLDSLKNNAEAAQAAKDHIDSMIAIMAARDTLAKLGKSAPTARDVAQAQSDLSVAINDKRRADAASKAQDELRDTTDRSYATRQKAEEMSAARTRNWNWLHAGDVRRYRALTDEERAAFTSVTADEVQTELAYEQQLNGLKIPQLKMEIGKMDKERAALLKKIDIAKAKSESYLAQAMAEEAAGMNVAQVRAEESRLEMMANQIRGMHGAGGGGSAVREKVAEFRALKQKLDAFYESRKPGKKASLAMYGPKGSIFTKPAFKGVEGFLKQQADLSTRIDAAETRLNELAARATPIMQRQGKDAIREIKPATAEEQDLIGMAEDAADERRASEVKVNALVATMKKQKARGNTEGMAETAKELADARAKLALDSRKLSRRMGSVTTEQSAEPSKLRSGSEESKKIPGVTKTKLSEAPIEKIPTAKQAVAVGNQLAAEKIAAGKKLTKKEVKSMDLAQKTALQAAAFDRLSTLNSQVSGMKQTIANLQQARSDYAAGRRKSFNLDVLKNAEARLAALEKETTKAREQAGVLEDVGEMTAAERNEDAIADMPLGQDLGEEDLLLSRGTPVEGQTRESLGEELRRAMGGDVTSRGTVEIHNSVDDYLQTQAPDVRSELRKKIPSDAKGFAQGNKAVLFAENIGKNEGLGVLLHEVGVHIGFRNFFNEGQYKALVNQVKQWAKRNDGSAEEKVGKAAVRRVEAAETENTQVDDELLAYAVEEAVRMGVNPQGVKGGSALSNWLKMVLASFKKALTAFGINANNLKAGDLVNFAYGCAQLELKGTWHGSDAAFTKFDVQRAGAGEGAFDRRFDADNSLGAGPYTTLDKEYGEYYQHAVPFGKAANETGYGNKTYEDYRSMDEKFMTTAYRDLSVADLQSKYESVLLSRYLSNVSAGGELNPVENKAAQQYVSTLREQMADSVSRQEKALASQEKRKVSADRLQGTKEELKAARNGLKAANTLDIEKIIGLKTRPAKGSLYRTLDDIPNEKIFSINSTATAGERPQIDALLKKYGDKYNVRKFEEDGEYYLNSLYYDMREKLGVEKANAQLKDAGIQALEQKNDRKYIERAYIDNAPEILAVNINPVGTTDDILLSRKADYKSDDALSKAAQRVVAQPKTLLQKVRGNSNVLLEAQMQGADMRAGLIKALENAVEDPRTMGSTKLFRQAIFSITAADQHMPITQMAATMGPPKMFKDEKGYYEVRSSMENSAIDVFDSVQDIPDRYGNAEAKMGMASMYMIAQRALNKGLAKLDTGAMGVTEQELQDVMRSVDADPELKAALEKTRKLYNAYNKGMIEWLASPQVAAISRDDAKAFLKDEDYVPYYRVLPNGNAELVFGGEKTITIGDIKHQPYLAELKGGDAKIMPLNQSVMRNTMLLVTKGMTNMAQKNIAYAMQAAGAGQGKDKSNLMPVHKGQGVADASIIRWTQEPDPSDPKDKGERWLRIQTNDTMFGGIPAELIIKSMEGAHLTLPAFLKLGGMAGDLLRAGVTRTPIYLARQLIRDPFAATATTGLDYGPLTAIFRANKEFLKMTRGQSETGAKLIEKGLVQSGIFDGSPADMEKMALQLAGGESLSLLRKLFKGADSLAIKADAATRALIYDNAIKNGLSEVEASHAVRESMNFYKRGLSPTVQYASRMIPFFNAQIQGLSVLAKAARGNMPFDEQLNIKRKFINNAMMLTGVGIAYAMAMDDDEYYKNAKPKDRYSNFFLHLPGVDEPVKLPIPYEFGWFFSAGVAAADAIKGEVNTPQQLRALKDMFVGAIPGASNLGMPQIIKPIAEVYANKSFFSGNPLESERLRKLDPEARYNASTTEMAKWFASMVPGLSPIQIEHIVSGYLGQVPLMVAASADGLFAKDSSIEEPTRRISQLPLIGSSFQRKYGGEEADVVYKLAADALETKRTFDNYRSTGKIELAKEYLQDHRAEIMVAPMALQYQKVMGQIRKQEEIVRGSRLDADAKAKRIEELDKQRQLQSERYMKAIQRAEAT